MKKYALILLLASVQPASAAFIHHNHFRASPMMSNHHESRMQMDGYIYSGKAPNQSDSVVNGSQLHAAKNRLWSVELKHNHGALNGSQLDIKEDREPLGESLSLKGTDSDTKIYTSHPAGVIGKLYPNTDQYIDLGLSRPVKKREYPLFPALSTLFQKAKNWFDWA